MTSGLLSTLGVRVRRVADLREGALYVADRKLLLLDIELSDSQIAQAMDAVLPGVAVPVEHPTS